jgi:5-methyltetrahydropteroyltriglutamate--homocysteine methyltransferase
MIDRAIPPFRADHVGSLLRPPALASARAEFKAGRINDDELAAAEDKAIRDVVIMQKEVGLRTVTDGELRRTAWHMDFISRLGGIRQGAPDNVRFRDEQGELEYRPPLAVVSAPITLERPIFSDAFTFLRDAALAGQTPKLTIPSPSMVHYRGGDSVVDASVYPDLDQFWADLAAAYREQIRGVYELECRYLQLDDVSLANVNDPAQRARVAELGGDPDHLHEHYIATINEALRERPGDLVVTTHLCRGNNQSMWVAEGGHDFVAEALFGELQVDGYFLEYDDERSGSFEPLRFVPNDKTIVLGLVTSKRPELEPVDQLKQRIDEASRYVDVAQLCLSPQCGFASTEAGNKLTEQEQWAKLRRVVEVAEEVWG